MKKKKKEALEEAESAACEFASPALTEKRVDWGNELPDAALLDLDNVEVPSDQDGLLAGSKAQGPSSHDGWLRGMHASSSSLPVTMKLCLPPELDLLFGSASKRLAIQYHQPDNRERIEILKQTSEEMVDPLMKQQTPSRGLKGKKRYKASKVLDPGEVSSTVKSCNNTRLYESDSSSSDGSCNPTALEPKKLRLEEDEILWNEAVLGDNASDELVLNEGPNVVSSGLVGTVLGSSSSEGKH